MNNRRTPKSHNAVVRAYEDALVDVDVTPVRLEDVRLSPAVEFAIVGGLGVLIVTGPAIASFLARKVWYNY